MGIYSIICCHVQCEYIEPGEVNKGAIKLQHIAARGDLGRLVLHLMVFGKGVGLTWSGVEVLHDSQPMHQTVEESYVNVTELAIKSYNETYTNAEPLVYTPYCVNTKAQHTPVD